MSGKKDTVAAAAVAPTKKVKAPPMKWRNKADTARFIRVFTKQKLTKKEQNSGAGTGMSGHGWNAITQAMNNDAPDGVVYTKEQLQNKIASLAKDYKSNEFVTNKTGLGLDATTGAFTGSDSVKDEIAKTDKNCKNFFKAPLENYALLDALLW